MNEMNITSAQYQEGNFYITATVDGREIGVPVDPNNRHYAEIQRLVDAGVLTIEEFVLPESE